jgi:hypothetical protein
MLTISRLTRPPVQPRRWRYRLRTRVVVILVVGLGLGWLARQFRREGEQLALVAELNQAGIPPGTTRRTPWDGCSKFCRPRCNNGSYHAGCAGASAIARRGSRQELSGTIRFPV